MLPRHPEPSEEVLIERATRLVQGALLIAVIQTKYHRGQVICTIQDGNEVVVYYDRATDKVWFYSKAGKVQC